MGLGALIERNLVYEVTNTQSGATDTYTIITDGGPGMYADWGSGEYRGLTSIPPAWRALNLLSGLLGRVPWQAYREVVGGPPVKLEGTIPLLHAPAAGFEPGLHTYRSWGMDRLGHGNGIGLVAARSPLGWPSAVTPVDASQVAVSRVTQTNPIADFRAGEIVYYIGGRWYPASEVVHFKGPCKPGALRGMGIVEVHFAAIDAARKLGAQVAAVSAAGVPTGVLKTLNPDLTKTQAQELKDAWLASQTTRTVAVLGQGVEFEPISWNPTEVQLNEMRAFNLTDWANIFGIDASFLGGQNPSRVYANLSEKGIDLLRFGNAGDLIAEFEATLTTYLPRGQYVKANLDFLLRADTQTRYQTHAVGIAAGFLTPDEAREYEERPPLTQAQKDDLVALKAPAGGGAPSTAPAGQGSAQRPGSGAALTSGQGGAAPRLAAVRELAEAMLDALIERGRHSFNPNQPRQPDGKWGDGSGHGGGQAVAVLDHSPAGGRRQAARRYSNDEMMIDYADTWHSAPEDQQEAVNSYAGWLYEQINGALRDADGMAQADQDTRDDIAAMTALMDSYRTPGVVTGVRALSGDPALPPPGQAVGKVIASRGFQSVSMTTTTKDASEVTSSDIARNYRDQPVRIRMTIPAGMPAIVVQGTTNAVASEREIVLPHNTRYAITGDEMEGDKRWLTVTALPPS